MQTPPNPELPDESEPAEVVEPAETTELTETTETTEPAGGAEAATRPRRSRRPSGRVSTLVVAAVLLVVFVAWAATRPVPYVSLGPGPTFNTLGSYDGKPLITVKGAPTYPTTGNLNLTTVSESGGPYSRLGLGEALAGWLEPHVAVVPAKLLYPPDTSPAQVEKQNQADFSDAESSATVAAFKYLGIPVTEVVKISSVKPGAPADGKLEVGDVVVAIDGSKVTTIDSAAALIRKGAAGQPATITVLRDSAERQVVVTPRLTEDQGKRVPEVGVTLATGYDSKVVVTYSLTGVGGPSAGLMFSLGLVDKLTPTSINNGAHVAGTGTIDDNGNVGPIGGIAQKMQGARQDGATIFLAPASNCQDTRNVVPHGLRLVKVTTLTSAVDALTAIREGKPTPTC